jgi:glycosyltransferase involved in cell wall biosynthesis
MSRLHNTGKYELAEFATYGKVGDHRTASIPWWFYPNAPNDDDPHKNVYDSNPVNQFGAWRFERVAMDFKPDIVWDIRDFWMMSYQGNSPLRDYYNWSIMPTVDSAPQQPEWIDVYSKADSVFTYEDWSQSVLKKESGGDMNLKGIAPPGVDIDIFTPVPSKSQHKKNVGLLDDIKIVGTVMRNQRRKLYPDLFIAFRKFLDSCIEQGKTEVAEKTFLYCHTSYPDVGWDIPALLKEHGLSSKVIFTYYCRDTGKWFPSFFQGGLGVSPFTGRPSAVLPSVVTGLTDAQLAEIMNLFDVYVQYAICEGFGMPQVEAASCGVPIMSVDYSAMSDVVRKLKGVPLPCQAMFRELETGADRALPNNDALASELIKFFSQPEPVRQRKGFQARQGVLKHYTWDATAKIWEDHFDSVELKGLQGQWGSPARFVPKKTEIPEGLDNVQFIEYAHAQILGKARTDHYQKAIYLRDLSVGASLAGKQWKKWGREDVIKSLCVTADNINNCEAARTGKMQLDMTDYIHFAHTRMK